MGNPLKLGEKKVISFNDIKYYFSGIITNIIIQIKDMINEMLYSWVIEKLIPLLTLFTLRLLMEQIEMYRKLIMDMITACSFKIERKGNLLDVVEYVDIDPKLEELKQTALSKTNC
jgi:predicted Zn-dependent protease with MMP-like domain